jgi:hypothetical protein
VAHLQRIMLGLADDLEHMSAHITTLPNLLDFVQVRTSSLTAYLGHVGTICTCVACPQRGRGGEACRSSRCMRPCWRNCSVFVYRAYAGVVQAITSRVPRAIPCVSTLQVRCLVGALLEAGCCGNVLLQVWHSTPGAPRFPSSLADVLEYRLVVGGAPSSAEAAEDVQHMRQTGQLLSSLRYARDQRQKDKEARYAAAARYNHQHLTAAVKQGLRQAGRGGGVPLEALVHAPAGAPLLGLPPTEGMKWAFAACQLMWHPAQHAEVRHTRGGGGRGIV